MLTNILWFGCTSALLQIEISLSSQHASTLLLRWCLIPSAVGAISAAAAAAVGGSDLLLLDVHAVAQQLDEQHQTRHSQPLSLLLLQLGQLLVPKSHLDDIFMLPIQHMLLLLLLVQFAVSPKPPLFSAVANTAWRRCKLLPD